MISKERLCLVLALVLVVFLRLPSLVDPKYYLDEGVYSSVAYEIGQGGTLYKTVWDLKPPGIFYVYLFFQTLFGAHAFLAQRIFNIILSVMTVLGIYKLARLLKFSEFNSVLAAWLSALLLGLPFFETQIFNTENIFIVTSLFAFIFGLKFKGRWQEPFAAGFLFGVGQWLKIHPIFDLAAFGIFALYKYRLDRKFWLPFAVGFATPLLALLVYLVTNGILADFVETNLSYNLFYVEELPQIKIFGNLLTRTLLLMAATVILAFLKLKSKISESNFLLLLWFVFVLYGALLSARAYGHYFIPVLIPTALLLASLIQNRIFRQAIAYRNIRIGFRTCGTLLLVFFPFVVFVILQKPFQAENFSQKVFSEQIHFYQHRLSYLTGRIGRNEFEKDFTPKPWRLRELKAYLDNDIPKSERVYLWGISPWANYILDRRPVQRYLMWFHILGVGDREEEVYQDLQRTLPEIIIVEDNQPEGETYEISRPPFLKLQNFIDANYKFETTIAGYNIYRLRRLVWAEEMLTWSNLLGTV